MQYETQGQKPFMLETDPRLHFSLRYNSWSVSRIYEFHRRVMFSEDSRGILAQPKFRYFIIKSCNKAMIYAISVYRFLHTSLKLERGFTTGFSHHN